MVWRMTDYRLAYGARLVSLEYLSSKGPGWVMGLAVVQQTTRGHQHGHETQEQQHGPGRPETVVHEG